MKAEKRVGFIFLIVFLFITLFLIFQYSSFSNKILAGKVSSQNFQALDTPSPSPSPSPSPEGCCEITCGYDEKVTCVQTTEAKCNQDACDITCEKWGDLSCIDYEWKKDAVCDGDDVASNDPARETGGFDDRECKPKGHCEKQDDGTGLCVEGTSSDTTGKKFNCVVYGDDRDKTQCNKCVPPAPNNQKKLWACGFGVPDPAGNQGKGEAGCNPADPNVRCNRDGCATVGNALLCKKEQLPGPNGPAGCKVGDANGNGNDDDCEDLCCKQIANSCEIVSCKKGGVRNALCRNNGDGTSSCESKGCCMINGQCTDGITKSQCSGVFHDGQTCEDLKRNSEGITDQQCSAGGCCEYPGPICQNKIAKSDCSANGGKWSSGMMCNPSGRCTLPPTGCCSFDDGTNHLTCNNLMTPQQCIAKKGQYLENGKCQAEGRCIAINIPECIVLGEPFKVDVQLTAAAVNPGVFKIYKDPHRGSDYENKKREIRFAERTIKETFEWGLCNAEGNAGVRPQEEKLCNVIQEKPAVQGGASFEMTEFSMDPFKLIVNYDTYSASVYIRSEKIWAKSLSSCFFTPWDGNDAPTAGNFINEDSVVALPTTAYFNKGVVLSLDCKKGNFVPAIVRDVGPWFPFKSYPANHYWDVDVGWPPLAEKAEGLTRIGDQNAYGINGASIDLSVGAINRLTGIPIPVPESYQNFCNQYGLRPIYWRFSNTIAQQSKKLVILDPGHGGTDFGKVSAGRKGQDPIKESDVNWDMAFQAGNILKSAGYEVVYTRSAGETKTEEQRINIANYYYETRAAGNPQKAALISIHAYPGENIVGTIGYYFPFTGEPPPRYDLALKVQQSTLLETYNFDGGSRTNLGIQPLTSDLLKRTKMPSTWIEVGSVSEEEQFFQDPQFIRLSAIGIAKGIKLYFNN